MEDYVFEDVLAGSTVTCGFPGLDTRVAAADGPRRARTLFFPGCSLINYALPLVKAVYDLLAQAGRVEGISLLCCGKILSFEPDGKAVRAAFEDELCAHVAAAGVERIVAACPNCVAALRGALAEDERTAGVEVVPLPLELEALGYRVDAEVAKRLLAAELEAGAAFYEVCAEGARPPLRFSVHDSCPDRATGEFADGLRALMPAELAVEPAHARRSSQCCGSLVRAAGHADKALEQSQARGAEAVAAGGSAIVAACVSCSFLLSVSQWRVPVFHYLELLFDWRVDWAHASQYMKLRFLFDDVPDAEASGRAFVGLEGADDGCKGVPAAARSQGSAAAAAGAPVDADDGCGKDGGAPARPGKDEADGRG